MSLFPCPWIYLAYCAWVVNALPLLHDIDTVMDPSVSSVQHRDQANAEERAHYSMSFLQHHWVSDPGLRDRSHTPLTSEEEKLAQTILANHSVVVAGVGKNIAWNAPTIVSRMKGIRNMFHHGHLVIYEDGSEDGTLEALKSALGDDPHSTVIHGVEGTGERTERLATARNFMMQAVQQQNEKQPYDFLVVIDMDLTCHINLNSVRKVLHNSEEWDAVSLSFDPYWDIWALRSSDLFNENAPEKALEMRPIMHEKLNALEDDEYLPVDSAFMLMSIYKMPHVLGAKYSGIYRGRHDCEHVAFHNSMNELHESRIRISPMPLCTEKE